jgi:hypothetical protein
MLEPCGKQSHPVRSMRLFAKLSLLIFALSASAWAQFPLSVGVKAGVPLTDAFSTTQLNSVFNGYSDSKNYIVGPMVELRLPFGLGAEADALYRPLNIATRALNDVSATSNSNYSSWEFPILAKYRFPFPIVKPYLEAGPSFRSLSSNISYLSNTGVTFGAGVDVHFLLHIAPEFRYTHWGSDSSTVNFTRTSSKQDQVEFLVGFSF